MYNNQLHQICLAARCQLKVTCLMVCGRCLDGLLADRPTGAANASKRLARGKGVVTPLTRPGAGETCPAQRGGQVLSVDASPRATGMTLLGPAVSPLGVRFPGWILRWLRATVPFGGEPLFRSG